MDSISSIFWSASVILNTVIIIIIIQIVLLVCCCCRKKDTVRKDIKTLLKNHNMISEQSDSEDDEIRMKELELENLKEERRKQRLIEKKKQLEKEIEEADSVPKQIESPKRKKVKRIETIPEDDD